MYRLGRKRRNYGHLPMLVSSKFYTRWRYTALSTYQEDVRYENALILPFVIREPTRLHLCVDTHAQPIRSFRTFHCHSTHRELGHQGCMLNRREPRPVPYMDECLCLLSVENLSNGETQVKTKIRITQWNQNDLRLCTRSRTK